jgi:hypothetical protein
MAAEQEGAMTDLPIKGPAGIQLDVTLENIPPELTLLPRWCVWVLSATDAKVPLQSISLKGAATNNREHFSTFTKAVERYRTLPGQYGLGFAFFPEDHIVGIDYDNVRDPVTGAVQEWAEQEMRRLSTYTEISPSGRGFKQFGFGALPSGDKCTSTPGSQTEMYDGSPGRERFFTVTGLRLPAFPLHVQDIAGPLADAYQRMLAFDLVEAFRRRGWLLGSERGDKIGVRCPWHTEHSKSTETTALFRNGKRGGGYSFKCLHGHCVDRTVADVYEFFGYKEPKTKKLTGSIIIQGGRLSEIVDEAETTLLSKSATGQSIPIYQRGGMLVHPITVDTVRTDDPVHRALGSTVLTLAREPWLLEQMGRAATWVKWNNATKDYIVVDPPRLYAETLLSRGEWKFPVLRGIVTAPIITLEGRVIEQPGYDTESGLLFDFPPGAFPKLNVTSTKDQAVRALAFFQKPLREFLFVDGAKSVALSAMLTALVRLSMHTSPLHAYDAPTAGSGKSLLAEMVGLLATGTRPPSMHQGKTEEEDEKRLSTVLFAGDAVIHIDNCERELSGDFLCSMLTQEVLQARILGQSERRILPSTALVLATGNNLSYAGDISRRVVPCRLDPKTEHPEQRVCSFDCHEEVRKIRPRLVAAGLTLLQAYLQAGKPEKLKPVGSFTDWEWIRGALVWVGEADPAEACAGVFSSDLRRDDLASVMDIWEQAFGNQKITLAELARRANEDSRTVYAALRDKLTEVACRGVWNGKSVGWWLKRNKDRIVGGRCLQCEAGSNMQMWRLSGASYREQSQSVIF